MALRAVYRSLLSLLPLEKRVAIRYYRRLRCWPDLKNPSSLNEKVLRRIVSERDPMFSVLADKLAVRAYVEQWIGTDVLVPLIAEFKNADDLMGIDDWSGIVIKPNHGSGMVKVIDEDIPKKEKLKVVSLAKGWLLRDYSKQSDEWHYQGISPKLLVERKISGLGEDLRDYKFHRFKQLDGSFIQVLQVVAGRSSDGYQTVFFDASDLNKAWHSPFGDDIELSRTEKLRINDIMTMNEALCPEYGYVRLDWYITREAVYFGEITFTPGGGMSKSFAGEFGEVMGRLWVA